MKLRASEVERLIKEKLVPVGAESDPAAQSWWLGQAEQTPG